MKGLIRLVAALLLLWHVPGLQAQETFPENGVSDPREGLHAFTNATIYTRYDQKIENATLVIRKGKVEAVGTDVAVPKGAVVHDLKGKVIYPSFIDLYTDYGMPKERGQGGQAARSRFERRPQPLTSRKGAWAWNEALKVDFRAHEHFTADDKTAKALRQAGFGSVLSHRMDGIARGTGTLVTLGEGRAHELIVKEKASNHLSFDKGSSRQDYPSSLMGAIALLRQTYYDGRWYAEVGRKEEVNNSLEAWNAVQALPQIFEVRDKWEALRAWRIGKEFGVNYIIKGAGDEYQRLDELKATGMAFIVPLNFPDAYDVEDPLDAMQVSLAEMKHWELAPLNPARLEQAGITFALTANGLKKPTELLANLRKAVRYGLSKEGALEALTWTPARLIDATDQLGSLEPGKLANFIITSGDLFDEKTKIYENWIKGEQFVIKPMPEVDLTGTYELKVGDQTWTLEVSGEPEKPKVKLQVNDSTAIDVSHKYARGLITLSWSPSKKEKGKVRLSGVVEDARWWGRGQLVDGTWVDWQAVPAVAAPQEGDQPERPDREKKKKEEDPLADIGEVWYPFTAYGWTERPTQKTWLIKNATVWTNEAEGVLEHTDVLIQDGKIAKVGKGLKAKDAIEIDATGMHLTPGIIDEHTHIAITRGVNEGTQASSAEVRVGDVINPEDINIYRQLSGGVTAAQQLHGSANPIGGQSSIIKFRWGYDDQAMKFEGADPFIKFALGENVKQSNWGDNFRSRFPQTRMGVEQVYEDLFTRAREYGELKRSGKPYRVDLELEALLEILEGKRFITCHSYRQSEINMLMKVAERFGFRVNTFTHILEGYKVADKMAKHGAGGSTFSDWWAYKFEVYEAIPYNGPLMHEQGVTVAYNSDDAEMARRLNQEAAKAVKYGGLSEEEALKFVTLNPAKLLHIDDRVGSIKVGKDADVVLWSDHPLSIYARAEMTFVDGIKFFDRKEEAMLRQRNEQERNRLIQKMLAAKKSGARTQRPQGRMPRLYHCDDLTDEIRGDE